MARYKVLFIPGDGVGPEIMVYAREVLERLGVFEVIERRAGMEYYRRTGRPYDEDLMSVAVEAGVVLKGPITTPVTGEYESVSVALRRALGVYADVRRFHRIPGVSLNEINVVIVREASEGLYTGVGGRFGGEGFNLRIISRRGAERVSRVGFQLARELGYGRVHAVHKATILRATDGLFLETFYSVARDYPDVEAGDLLVDSTAYRLVKSPEGLGVLVTPNLYGDILSDVAAGVVGSIGLCAAIEVGERGLLAEPIHGTAPDIAGKGIANPVSAFRAAQYLLEWLGKLRGDRRLAEAASALDKAVWRVVAVERFWTPDLGGNKGTREVAERIIALWESILEEA